MTLVRAQTLTAKRHNAALFRPLNFTLESGQYLEITGPNGSGKTTLLRIIAGSELPTGGQIQTAKNLKIGYLEQHSSLLSTEGTLWSSAHAVGLSLPSAPGPQNAPKTNLF